MAASWTVAATQKQVPIGGGLMLAYGTYVAAGGSTGGDIVTGGTKLVHLGLQSAGNQTAPKVTAISGGTGTVYVTANDTGTWFSICKGG